MPRIKVLVGHHMARQKELDRIASVDPCVDVVQAPFVDEMTRGWVDSFRTTGSRDLPDLKEGEFERHVGDAEVIFGLRLPKNITEIAPGLKWMHVYGAGVDYIADTGLLEKGILLTNSSGINAPPIAEFVIMYMLMHVKQMSKRVDAQRERKWVRYVNDELREQTLGIVGPGRIGAAVAQRAAGFEMRILATRRAFKPGESLPGIDEIYPRDRLHDMLARCDFVVLAVSLTDETRSMFSEAEFRAMKPGSFFMNVSRGGTVDQDALIRALKDGHLGGAGLDVLTPEPLPEDSELWDLPNVIITPHNSGGIRSHAVRATEFFCQNLKRYIDGQPLENVIDPKTGY